MLKTFTTSDELFDVLSALMKISSLTNFRLVGGTALSLLLGHRKSEDIDLFTHQPYGNINFKKIETEIRENFSYVRNSDEGLGLQSTENNFGLHLYIGHNTDSAVKTDILNWNDDFLYPEKAIDGIRMATFEEIALMKLDTVSRGGRKKDFWDLSEILEHTSLTSLLKLYEEKYPYYEVELVKQGMTNFDKADNMPDPVCLRGKIWELVKVEMMEAAKSLKN
jgi:hypothetical protein